jgi:hypothetical protein
MTKIQILYDYKPFDESKLGLFNASLGGEYKIKEILIIGETDLHYIFRLKKVSEDNWIDDKVIYETFILPIGIHKSRLIQWMPTQLSIF